jgi:Rhs element Vgr protein
MTAPSPVQLATSIPSYAVTANGSALDSSIQIVSIETWNEVNKLPKARLVISDGSAADATFAISETASLIPGVALTIAIGYGSSQTQIFSGVIHRQGLEVTANGPSRLVVEATDKAMVMTLARANAITATTTDSAVMEKLISDAGCTPKVTGTSTQHEAIVQYYSTAWDMLIIRAQANGMVVTTSGGTVTVAPPDTSTSAVLTLTFGQSILDFRADMDASTQFTSGAIQSFAWDSASQALVQSSSASASVSTPGNISSTTLAGVFGVSQVLQQTGGEMIADELTDWSSAELLKSQLSKIRGQVRFQGSALVTPGSMVTLAGLGARFNGDAWVSGVHHRLAEGLWLTTVDIGLSPSWFAAVAPQVPAPGASGQLPPINNVQTGVVKQIDSDPDGEFRVLVTVPLLASEGAVWARFGSFYASNAIGSNFYPEIGDEVVLAFLNGDPRYPVILGSLYSKANPPPYPPVTGGDGAPNDTKSFWTKSNMHIDFVEHLPKMLLTTPAPQSIAIDDSAGSIVISDKNGNTITMDSSGITLKSASDITLTASGSIKMTADADVTISASASFSTTASASAKLTCDGPVQIKGATVALNP